MAQVLAEPAGLLLGEGFPRWLVVGIAVAFAGVVLIGLATRAVQNAQWQTLGRLAARFADTVRGLSTLKLFSRQYRAVSSIEKVTASYRRETMRVLRVSFPHECVPDGPYERTAETILTEARNETWFRMALAQGLLSLNQMAGGDFRDLDDDAALPGLRDRARAASSSGWREPHPQPPGRAGGSGSGLTRCGRSLQEPPRPGLRLRLRAAH